MRKRTVLEAAFRLEIDMRTATGERMHALNLGISQMQMRALRAIWSTDDMTSQYIASTLKRDKAQVTRLVNELVEQGLVEREPNPEDMRSKLLRLTEAGNHIFRQIEEVQREVYSEMVNGIDESDLQTFFKVSDQLSENIRQME